jgi:hypothetical protein
VEPGKVKGYCYLFFIQFVAAIGRQRYGILNIFFTFSGACFAAGAYFL